MYNRGIEVRRNFIERSLMIIKNNVQEHKKIFLYSFIMIIIITILIIAGIIGYENIEASKLNEFERILYKYGEMKLNDEGLRKKELQKTVDELNKVIDSSYWGYVNENGYYLIALRYLSLGMNREAKEYLLKFVDNSPDSFFAPIALQRAGIACEQLNDQEGAFILYQRLERDYVDSAITDEIYYDLGRMYHKKGDISKAREYYNRVISLYPTSVFALRAKKRLFLIGYDVKEKKREELT